MDSTQEQLGRELLEAADHNNRTQQRLRDAALDYVFYDKHRGVAVTRKNAPGLFQSVENLSAKARLPVAPRLYITPTFPSFYGGPNAGGMGLPAGYGGLVVLNEPLLKAYKYTPGREVPPATLQAVIAHELSHVKDGFAHAMNTRFLPLMAMPALAVGSLYLYDKTLGKARQSGKHHYDKDTLSLALDSASAEMLDELGAPGHAAISKDKDGGNIQPAPDLEGDTYTFSATEDHKRSFVERARYLVAAAAGLGAGLMMTRHFSLAAEYRADRMAVKLTGGAEPMIEALSVLYKESRKPFEEYMQKQAKSNKSGLQKAAENLWKTIEGEFIHAHPGFKDRAKAMREYAATLAKQGGQLL